MGQVASSFFGCGAKARKILADIESKETLAHESTMAYLEQKEALILENQRLERLLQEKADALALAERSRDRSEKVIIQKSVQEKLDEARRIERRESRKRALEKEIESAVTLEMAVSITRNYIDCVVERLMSKLPREYHHHHRDGSYTIKYGNSVSRARRRRHHKRKDSKYIGPVDFNRNDLFGSYRGENEDWFVAAKDSPTTSVDSPGSPSYASMPSSQHSSSFWSDPASPVIAAAKCVPSPVYIGKVDKMYLLNAPIVTYKPDIVWSSKLKKYVAPDYNQNIIEAEQIIKRQRQIEAERTTTNAIAT